MLVELIMTCGRVNSFAIASVLCNRRTNVACCLLPCGLIMHGGRRTSKVQISILRASDLSIKSF
jgi:hypothetical protein